MLYIKNKDNLMTEAAHLYEHSSIRVPILDVGRVYRYMKFWYDGSCHEDAFIVLKKNDEDYFVVSFDELEFHTILKYYIRDDLVGVKFKEESSGKVCYYVVIEEKKLTNSIINLTIKKFIDCRFHANFDKAHVDKLIFNNIITKVKDRKTTIEKYRINYTDVLNLIGSYKEKINWVYKKLKLSKTKYITLEQAIKKLKSLPGSQSCWGTTLYDAVDNKVTKEANKIDPMIYSDNLKSHLLKIANLHMKKEKK